MTEEKLIKANDLEEQIANAKLLTEKISSINDGDTGTLLTNYNKYVPVPPELKNVFITLLKNHYEEKLNKLEQEFKEM